MKPSYAEISGITRAGWRTLRLLRMGLALLVGLALHLALAWPARAALVSGVYQTLPGASVREWGDRVPNGSRIMPLFATLTFDLSSATPSLTAVITNAVWEGRPPFPLTLHSSSGAQLVSSGYRFDGDYLYPGYFFSYEFSASTNGQVLWNGQDYWSGGHAWYVTFSNVTLVQLPLLEIAHAGATSVQISWSTNFADHVLESTASFPAAAWSSVTNTPVTVGDNLSVTLDLNASSRFFRLRRP